MLDAEQSVIGCLMMQPDLLDKASAELTPKMFEAEPLARIYSCMQKLKKAGLPVDAVTVISKLGQEYETLVRTCAELTPSLAAFPTYCGLVLDAWRERDLTKELSELAISGRTADEISGELQRILERQHHIMEHTRSTSESTWNDAMAEAYKNLFAPDTAIKTEWQDMNERMGGFQRGGLYIIAARPGDGKTDFSLHLAVQLAAKYKVDYRSLEMTKEQLVHRVLSRVCTINSTALRDHQIDDAMIQRIGYVTDRMSDLRFVMDDTSGITLADIENKLTVNKPDVMIVDYLGLMKSDSAGKKQLWEITGEITHGLKAAAQKHNCAIIALVQMNRAIDKAKEPTLSDLRGGGDIEADADGVLFVRPHKEEGFLSGDESWQTDIIIAKNRHGGTGTLSFDWQPQYHKYTPIEGRYDE